MKHKFLLLLLPPSENFQILGAYVGFHKSFFTAKTIEKQKQHKSPYHYIFWNGYNKPLSHQISIYGLNLTVSEPKLYNMEHLYITSVYIMFFVFQSSFPEWFCLNSSAYVAMVIYFGSLHAAGWKCSILLLWISKFLKIFQCQLC